MPTNEQLTRFRARIHEEADELPDAALLDTLLYVEENKRLFAERDTDDDLGSTAL